MPAGSLPPPSFPTPVALRTALGRRLGRALQQHPALPLDTPLLWEGLPGPLLEASSPRRPSLANALTARSTCSFGGCLSPHGENLGSVRAGVELVCSLPWHLLPERISD